MKTSELQMTDLSVNADWWRRCIQYFVKPGDEFEIRCWKEERDEIKKALSYGKLCPSENDTEASIQGTVSQVMKKELLSAPEPEDKSVYNKMTDFFSICIDDKLNSQHYGTQLYLFHVSDTEEAAFWEMIRPYQESFSIAVHTGCSC